jgi:hypothetical protein
MKLTKNNLAKAMTNASIASVRVMYNWDDDMQNAGSLETPPLTNKDITSSEYNTAASNHNMLFNNSKYGLDHFGTSQAALLTSATPGLSIGSTHGALSTSGFGTFAGTDLIQISNEINDSDWCVVINFEEDSCPVDPSKRRILLSSTGSNATDGFNLGINGAKHLFYEFYDKSGVLRVYTILDSLEERSIVAVSKSETTKNLSIYLFNSVESTAKKLSVVVEEAQLGSKWCLGGVSPIPSAGDFNQMFEGKMYEFLLFDNALSEDQVIEIGQSLLADAITIEEYATVTETYYATLSHAESQVQVGTEVTGYTEQTTTVQTESGGTITLYDQVPVTSPVYQTQVSYTQDTNPSTREVQQLTAPSKAYDYSYIENYAPTCVLLETPQSSVGYEVYTSNKYTKYITKKGSFISGSGYFALEENYDSAKSVVIHINGLLVEEGVDYTRVGINIKKYSGEYTESDLLVYDVIDNGAQAFSNYAGGTGTLVGEAGKDLYLDGKKLVYGQDYQDSAGDIDVLTALSAGKMGIISRHADVNLKLNGTIDVYNCFTSTQPLISEMFWVEGLRKQKDIEYYLNNPCDLANSNIVVAEKNTVIYENNTSHYNI